MEASRPAAAAIRTAHILHLAPPDAIRLARLALRNVPTDPSGGTGVRTLVLTGDPDTAIAAASAAGYDAASGVAHLVALTSPGRAERVLRTRAPEAVVVPVGVAAALISRSALQLATVRQVIVAMPDAPGNARGRDALDAVMAELPRDTTRTLVAARETPEVEELVARHFFKARRTREDGAPPQARPGFAIRVVATTPAARWEALRRLLDEADPASAIVFTDDTTHAAATRSLATLGYGPDDDVRAVRDAIPAGAVLAVFPGVPDAITLSRALASAPMHLVVLCAPRDIPALRTIAGPVPVVPWVLDGPRARAESADVATRARLREILSSGAHARELLWLAPLLDEYDGSEVAAAALVYASEVQRPVTPPALPVPTPAASAPPPSQKRFDRAAGSAQRFERGPRREGPDERRPPRDSRPPQKPGSGRNRDR